MTRIKSKVGPKGQAVIPKPVRDALGIRPGDEVVFSTHGDHAHLEKRSPAEQLEAFFAAIPDRPGKPMDLTARELKALLETQHQQEHRRLRP